MTARSHRATPLRPDPALLAAFWDALVVPGTVHEVRIPKTRRDGPRRFYRPVIGYFNDRDRFVEAARTVTGEDAEGVYLTLNPVDSSLLARASNRLEQGAPNAAGDTHVARRHALFIDIDPKRLSGISATQEEMAKALALRDQILEFLRQERRWPEPLAITASGNGGGLLYRLDLPNDHEAGVLVARALKALDVLFSTEDVTVDVGTANASRLTKVLGTVAAKGDDLPERPWRLATGQFPADARTVTADQLRELASMCQPEGLDHPDENVAVTRAEGASHYDIPEILTAQGITWIEKLREYGTVYALDRCLTSNDHTDGAALIQLTSGAMVYRCHHDRCSGKHWNPDAKRALGLGTLGRTAVAAQLRSFPVSAGQPAPAEWSRFGNFTARIVRDVSTVTGSLSQHRVMFELEVQVEGGSPQRGTITARDFQDNGKLRSTLQEIGRSDLRIESSDMASLRTLIQTSNRAQKDTIYEHTGWITIDGHDHFLMPGVSIGASRPRVELPDEPGLQRFRFETLSEEDYRDALRLLAGPLFEAMPEQIAYPALAHAFLPAIHRGLGTDQKYLLHLCGETATFKTTYASLLMALWGPGFADGAPPATWGSTVNAIEGLGFVVKDALMLVDDFKPAMVESAGITRLVQNYADGTGRARLTAGAELNGSQPVRAHLLSTGEDLPRGESSVIARTLILHVGRGEAKLDKIGLVQEAAPLLAGLMPPFIKGLLEKSDAMDAVARSYRERRSALGPRVGLRGGANPGRIAQNLAMNAAAFEALVGWLQSEGAIDAGEATRRLDVYDSVIDPLIDGMTQTVRQERESTIFVETLSELVSNRRFAILSGRDAEAEPGQEVLGWVEHGTVYLLPEASFSAVDEIRPLRVSPRALHRQLETDDMLAERDGDQLTVRKRFKGVQGRYLAVKADCLGLGSRTSGVHIVGNQHRGISIDGLTDEVA